ncbi:MAG TPA: hypothetical protein VLE73_00065 [Candidatus Saccharimonadales bacterium]|nr:hypothetical protein [Candidatus Saccharimonadales bacterium]
MTVKTVGLGAVAFLAAISMFVASSGHAYAHYVYELGMMYQTSEDCVDGYSEVSHGNWNKGYSKTTVGAKFNYNGSFCAEAFYRPAGYLKNRARFQFQAAPGIANCRDTGDIYNTTKSAMLTVTQHWSTNCGSWNYRTELTGLMLNGSWKGGVLSSGFHWLNG